MRRASLVLFALSLLGAPTAALAAHCAPPAAAPVCCASGPLVWITPAAFAWGPLPLGCGAAPPLDDVVAGDLGVAFATKDIALSAPFCVEQDAPLTLAAVFAPVPPVGTGFWFLSRAGEAGPDGETWNEVSATQIPDRDLLLGEPGGTCP